MSSLKLIEEHKALAPTSTKANTLTSAIPLRIRHTDTDAATGTVAVTATSVELVNDATTTASLAYADYATVTLMKAAVNALENWECVAVDAIESKALATGSFGIAAAAVATSSQGVAVNYSSTAAAVVGSIQYGKFLANDGLVNDSTYMNEVNAINFTATNSSGTNTLNVYGCKSGVADALIYTETLEATSVIQSTEIDAVLADKGVTPGYGKRLVVSIEQQTAGGTLNVIGKSYRASPVAQ